MKKTNRKAYAGYKRAHLYSAIATVILGLCLIAATIIVVCCFKVEVKVENPTTTINQTQPINSDVKPESEAKTDVPTDATTKAKTDVPTDTTTDTTIDTTTDTTTIEIKENPTENTVEEPTEDTETIKYSTLTVTVNIYTNICKTKFVEITMPVGTTLSLSQIKTLILDEFPTFNYARTVGVPATYTFTEEDNGLPGIIKISTITVEATETEENNPEVIQAETEEPTVVEETPETEAEAAESEENNNIIPEQIEEPAQAPTEAEPVEEPIITSILTITVNIYTNICKTVFVKIERPVGSVLTRQEIKDLILEMYPTFNRVRSTGTPDSYTFVEEDGQLPGVIKID